MTDEDFRKLLATVDRLTAAQLATLDASVRGRLDAPPTTSGPAPDGAKIETETDHGIGSIAELDAQFAARPICPHCQSTAAGKWGAASGLRRYRCKSCKATFNALTGTPLAQLHKKELWIGHGQALVDGISLRKVAARLDIDLTTAFRWRHRFLKAPKALKPKVLSGTVEADETYFLKSNKGSRTLDRKARKRRVENTLPA